MVPLTRVKPVIVCSIETALLGVRVSASELSSTPLPASLTWMRNPTVLSTFVVSTGVTPSTVTPLTVGATTSVSCETVNVAAGAGNATSAPVGVAAYVTELPASSLSSTESTVQALPSGTVWGTVNAMSTCSSVGGPDVNVWLEPDNEVTAPQPLAQLAVTVALAKPARSSVTCKTTPIAPGPSVTSTLAGSVVTEVKTGGVVSVTALAEMAARPPPTLAAVAIATMNPSARPARLLDSGLMTRLPPIGL